MQSLSCSCGFQSRWPWLLALTIAFFASGSSRTLWAQEAEADKPEAAATPDKPAEKPSEPPPSGRPMPAEPTTAPPPPQAPITNKELYQRLLKSVVFIVVETPQYIATGSGWLLDAEKKLVVTNFHVVEMNDEVKVFAPAYKEGELIAERSHYVQKEKSISAKVFDSDRGRDLAVLQLEELPADFQAIPLAEKSASPGEAIFSIGSPGASDALFIYTTGAVRAKYKQRYRLSQDQVVDATVVETTSPTNPGDSGGPVVNDRGELVAVVSASSPDARLISTFIDVSEVKGYRDEMLKILEPKTAEEWLARGKRYRETGRNDRAISDLTEAIKLDGKLALAFANRGWAFANKGDSESALGDFSEAITLNSSLADAYHGRGYLYNEEGKYDEAIADCTKAIRFDPKDASAYNNRAWAYSKKGDLNKAVGDYNRALEVDPNNPVYYNNRGDAYYYAQDYQRALNDYSSAIQADNRYALAYFNRAWVNLNNLNSPDAAIEDFTKAIEVSPNYAAAYENRGEAWWVKKEFQQALNDYNAALQIDSNYAEAYSDRGYLYHYHLNDAQQALNDYNESIRLSPNVASYYNLRGNLYYDHKEYDKAIADYSQAINLNNRNALYYKHRGNAYAAVGDSTRAGTDYAEASRLDPSMTTGPPKQQDRRYIYIINHSDKEITVYLQYHTKTVNGGWAWYPAEPGRGRYLQFTFAPGEESYLQDRDLRIMGDRMRIWADSGDGSTWYRDRDQDVVMCETTYVAPKAETYTYTFDP